MKQEIKSKLIQISQTSIAHSLGSCGCYFVISFFIFFFIRKQNHDTEYSTTHNITIYVVSRNTSGNIRLDTEEFHDLLTTVKSPFSAASIAF